MLGETELRHVNGLEAGSRMPFDGNISSNFSTTGPQMLSFFFGCNQDWIFWQLRRFYYSNKSAEVGSSGALCLTNIRFFVCVFQSLRRSHKFVDG